MIIYYYNYLLFFKNEKRYISFLIQLFEMEYKFEVSNSFPTEFRIILCYLGQQKHYQEIGSDKQEIEFGEGPVTALKKTKLINYTTDLEKIDYMLGYEK